MTTGYAQRAGSSGTHGTGYVMVRLSCAGNNPKWIVSVTQNVLFFGGGAGGRTCYGSYVIKGYPVSKTIVSKSGGHMHAMCAYFLYF